MKNPFYILSFILFSGLSHVYGQNNTVYGIGAGKGGSDNTHIGYQVAYLSTGSSNVFLGSRSGSKNTTGSHNTFLGYNSGLFNNTGKYNTFLGSYSGFSNSTGTLNTVLGSFSGHYNTTGNYNTFLGSYSGFKNNTGWYNTFLGYESGRNNTTGSSNTFLGSYSGFKNTTGYFNIFLGTNSGTYNTTGSNNTFLGPLSGYGNTTGSNNTFLGFYSGLFNKSGGNNVFIGYKAGYSETGSNRLYIDNNDDNKPLLYGNFYHNVLSIGTKYTGTAYKLVVPGKVRAASYWVRVNNKDTKVGRVANPVNTLQDALSKIQKVEAERYHFQEETSTAEEDSVQTGRHSKEQAEEQVTYGLVAESMQQVFPELVLEEEEEVSINYQAMVPVLVEAIKELTRETQAEIARLQQELTTLRQAIRDGTSAPALDDTAGSQLYQNYPNPFDQSTAIGYRVAAEARQVSLIITNLQGVTVQRYDNLSTGQGQVEITSGSLGAGTYVYTLVVDGKPVAAHRMMLSR